MANPVLETLRIAVTRNGLSDGPLIVALSGGPDSLALTLGLVELRSEHQLDLRIAHFDHQLRTDSATDAAFVEKLAGRFGLPVFIGRGDVRAIARLERIGIEEAARRARYRFLAECSSRVHATAVLVAHTRDDQTETRLMHWLRGSGLSGLVGMADDLMLAVPGGARVRVVRPLLKVRHQDTVAFCQERGVRPCLDPSNADTSFLRNRVRHGVLPELRAINPRLDDALERLARHADVAEQFIQAELDRRVDAMVSATSSEWRIDRSGWRGLPVALKQALLCRASSALAPSGGALDFDNLDEGVHAADAWTAGRSLAWPGGIELRVEYDSILVRHGSATVGRIEPREIAIDADQDIELPCSADSEREPRILHVRRRSERCDDHSSDAWHCDLDLAKIATEECLVVRGRRDGDWIRPEGMTGRKKVQDLLVDAHVPNEERDAVPIVATSFGVAWVAGVRRDGRYVANDHTAAVLCLRLSPPGPAEEGSRRLSGASLCTI